MKEHIRYTAVKIRTMIQEEMKNKIISLSADIATKNNRSIFGSYAQYSLDGKVTQRCLGMIGMHDRHTGKYMAELFQNLLERYKAGFTHVFSITTDNASNMRGMVSYINELSENENEECSNSGQSEEQIPVMDSVGDPTIDREIAEYVANDTNELETLLDRLTPQEDDWTLSNYDDSWVEGIQRNNHFLINGVNCAAHTLQLAVKDAIEQIAAEEKNVITLCRMFAKFTRQQTTIYEFEKMGIKKRNPPLDVCTRWSSTYLMVITHENIQFEYYKKKLKKHSFTFSARWGTQMS